jgi:CRISPR-associated Cas5-like protein
MIEVGNETTGTKVVEMRRLLVLVFVPWAMLALFGVTHAHAATYPNPPPSTTVTVLPSTESRQPAHGGSPAGASLPFTGGDALLLTGFAAAILLPGIALVLASRRRRPASAPRD